MSVKRKKPAFHFNVAIISFLMIFIYLLGQMVVACLNSGELAIYEVVQSRIHNSVQATGLILRDEVLVKADRSGYMNYYVNESQKVAKNGLVYTCDETGQVHDYISNLLTQEENMSAEDYSGLKEEIAQFQDVYTDSQFQRVYGLKYDLVSKAMQMGDVLMAKHMDEIEAKMGSGSFIKNYSKESGLVTYLEDGFETKKFENLKASDFDTSAYTKEELKQSKKIKKGKSVYRLCRSAKWQLVVPLEKKDYRRLYQHLGGGKKESFSVAVDIVKDELTLTCPISFKKKKGQYYGIVEMNNYLARYAKERYLKVELEIRVEDGLKIPNSSIVEKEFYKIPKQYMNGSSAAQKDITIKRQEKGEVTFETKRVDIGRSEDGGEETGDAGYYYVLAEEIPPGTLLSMPESSDTMLVKETVKLPGVYNINRGYADFRCIEVIMENEDYTLVKEGVANSISQFDRIALNGSTVENNEIIY